VVIVGEMGCEAFGYPLPQAARRPEDFEIPVAGEEGLEQVLLGPEDLAPLHPVLGVVVGQEDVVDMDVDALFQAGKDLQDLVEDIAADLDAVAGESMKRMSFSPRASKRARGRFSTFSSINNGDSLPMRS